ncbi:MAG: protease HtpX [Verrucomicrobia bacterium]|nr:protease HtpX [Verrucomicrobiota bacterium]MBM3871751.1 protease HtpX [Verrucomicrobiota bacterium]
MGKRFLLFIAVNLLVMITLTIVFQIVLHFFPQLGGRRGTEGWLGYLAVFSLIMGFGGAFISLALSRVMAKWMMGVHVIDPQTSDSEQRELVRMVHGYAQRAGLPAMPEVGIYESPDVNAFATGPSKSRSLVAVSTGLLHRMNRTETEGVIAHEVAHIANGDMVTMTLVQGVINAFVIFLSRVLAFLAAQALAGNRSSDDDRPSMGQAFLEFALVIAFEILFTLLGAIVVAWFSRKREFRADAGGMLLAGKAQMVGALQALQRIYDPQLASEGASSGLQALKISGKSGGLMALFATHPPLEERIAHLESLGR